MALAFRHCGVGTPIDPHDLLRSLRWTPVGAATSTDYGGPVARRRRADDGEAEQTRRARRGREQDVAEISGRMYDEIRSSRDPRDHVEDG